MNKENNANVNVNSTCEEEIKCTKNEVRYIFENYINYQQENVNKRYYDINLENQKKIELGDKKSYKEEFEEKMKFTSIVEKISGWSENFQSKEKKLEIFYGVSRYLYDIRKIIVNEKEINEKLYVDDLKNFENFLRDSSTSEFFYYINSVIKQRKILKPEHAVYLFRKTKHERYASNEDLWSFFIFYEELFDKFPIDQQKYFFQLRFHFFECFLRRRNFINTQTDKQNIYKYLSPHYTTYPSFKIFYFWSKCDKGQISVEKCTNLIEHLFFEECIKFDENNSIEILPKFEECEGFLDGDLRALIWSLFYLDCYSDVQSILERYVNENEYLDQKLRHKRIKAAKFASLSLFFVASEQKNDVVKFRLSSGLFEKVQDLMEDIRNSEVRAKFIQMLPPHLMVDYFMRYKWRTSQFFYIAQLLDKESDKDLLDRIYQKFIYEYSDLFLFGNATEIKTRNSFLSNNSFYLCDDNFDDNNETKNSREKWEKEVSFGNQKFKLTKENKNSNQKINFLKVNFNISVNNDYHLFNETTRLITPKLDLLYFDPHLREVRCGGSIRYSMLSTKDLTLYWLISAFKPKKLIIITGGSDDGNNRSFRNKILAFMDEYIRSGVYKRIPDAGRDFLYFTSK